MTTLTATAVCQLPRHLTDGHPGPCRQAAAWAATVHCPHHGPIRVLICDYHRGYVADGRRVTCAACEQVMAVWLLERVR